MACQELGGLHDWQLVPRLAAASRAVVKVVDVWAAQVLLAHWLLQPTGTTLTMSCKLGGGSVKGTQTWSAAIARDVLRNHRNYNHLHGMASCSHTIIHATISTNNVGFPDGGETRGDTEACSRQVGFGQCGDDIRGFTASQGG